MYGITLQIHNLLPHLICVAMKAAIHLCMDVTDSSKICTIYGNGIHLSVSTAPIDALGTEFLWVLNSLLFLFADGSHFGALKF